jgi:cell division protein ZapA
VGDDRLILMASLVVADELWDLRRQLDDMKAVLAEARRDKSTTETTAKATHADLVSRVSAAADRLELLNTQFLHGGSGEAANRR